MQSRGLAALDLRFWLVPEFAAILAKKLRKFFRADGPVAPAGNFQFKNQPMTSDQPTPSPMNNHFLRGDGCAKAD